MKTNYILENSKLKLEITINNDTVSEKYFGVNDGNETLLVETLPESSFCACKVNIQEHTGNEIGFAFPDEPVVLFNGSPDEYTEIPKLSVGESLPKVIFKLFDHHENIEKSTKEIKLFGKSAEGDVIERTISIDANADFFEIKNELHLKREIELEYCADYYKFAPGKEPDFTWTPHMKFDPSCISSDWTFKSPSAMIQKDSDAVSLVPDLDYLYEDNSLWYCNTGLDLNLIEENGPRIGYGLIPCEPHYHSMFIHPEGLKREIPKGTISYRYFIFLNNNAPERQSYRRIVQFLWDKYGHKNLLAGYNAQMKSFNVMEKEAWHWMSRKFWIEFDYKGYRCGGFRDYHRELDDDIWFFGWWNSLRTAYGMELYARRNKHQETSRKANAIYNLIINSPRKDGAFPAVYLKINGERTWTAGSPSNFGGPIYDYHTFSMSWTAYWLLKWKEDLVKDDDRIMPFCEDYAEFLLRNQQSSGFIPSYYKETDLKIDEGMGMNKENAEPAVCALFLIEMYKVTNEEKYLDAAEKAIRYVEREIVPYNKWFDYETFYSCSPKKYGTFDKITGQYPQCNMALLMLAHSCIELQKIKDNGYLELGKRVLDYLSLFQQVWSHPRMEPNLFGGFTTQNTDSEWSDARQSYCAIIFMDYFEETGNPIYFERAVAAMRATLAISPYENWSHRGYNNEPGFFSSFHWGIGTGLTTVEMLFRKYGDIYIDLDKNIAYGLNGCTVSGFNFQDNKISMNVESIIHFTVPMKLVVRVKEEGKLKIKINGESLGEYSVADLREGISWLFQPWKKGS